MIKDVKIKGRGDDESDLTSSQPKKEDKEYEDELAWDDESVEEEEEEEEKEKDPNKNASNSQPASRKPSDLNQKEAPGAKQNEDEDDDEDEDEKAEKVEANVTKDAGKEKKAEEEEQYISGEVTVLHEGKGGRYDQPAQYYLKFLFKARFLAFFDGQNFKNIPQLFIKMKNVTGVQDFYNNIASQVYIEANQYKSEIRLVLSIADSKVKDKWVDIFNQLRDEQEDDFEEDTPDYGRTEVEMKYILAQEYERHLLADRQKNYNYDTELKWDYFRFFDIIYDYKPELKDFEWNEVTRFLYYGTCRLIRKQEKYDTKNKVKLNEAESVKGYEMIAAIALSKQLPEATDPISVALIEKVTKSRRIARWMDFNLLYIFRSSDAKKLVKKVDEMIPYKFLIDLNEYKEIKLLNANKMAVQIANEKSALIFTFTNIVMCMRFYLFALKAQENIGEIYKMNKFDIRTNLDFCMFYYNRLVTLGVEFTNIVQKLYDRGITEKAGPLRYISLNFNQIMIGFMCKKVLDLKYVGVFLRSFEGFYFDQVKKKILENRMRDPQVIIDLINNLKFHEELLLRWKIGNLRVHSALKNLEMIYIKLYFNKQALDYMATFQKLADNNFYFFEQDKKVSYFFVDIFNQIKSHLAGIKNIRKDRDFKLNILMFVKRCLCLVLENLRFLSKDEKIKLPIMLFPSMINGFFNFKDNIIKFLKYVSEMYKIPEIYFVHFFSKEKLTQETQEICDSLSELYQKLISKDIDAYFQNVASLDTLNIRDMSSACIESKLNYSDFFLPMYNSIVESAVFGSVTNNILELLAKEAEIDMEVIIKKFSEYEAKINTYKFNDPLIKAKTLKTLRALNDFFARSKDLESELYIISNAFFFKKNYDKLKLLVSKKSYTKKSQKDKVEEYLNEVIQRFQDYKKSEQAAMGFYKKARVLARVCKTTTMMKANYERHKDELEKGGDKDQADTSKVSDLPQANIICRYFCYRKSTKQNYGYIKYKIKKLQFDERLVYTQDGKIYIKDKDDPTNTFKALMIAKVTMVEKFEGVYITLYYKHNMMLILELGSEPLANSYLKKLNDLVNFFRSKPLNLEVISISDPDTVREDLRFFFKYQRELKFDFLYPRLLSSLNDAKFRCAKVFSFRNILPESRNELIERLRAEALKKGEKFEEKNIKFDREGRAKFEVNSGGQMKMVFTRRKSADCLKLYDYRKLAFELKNRS